MEPWVTTGESVENALPSGFKQLCRGDIGGAHGPHAYRPPTTAGTSPGLRVRGQEAHDHLYSHGSFLEISARIACTSTS